MCMHYVSDTARYFLIEKGGEMSHLTEQHSNEKGTLTKAIYKSCIYHNEYL